MSAECSICYDNIQNTCFITICGHAFHNDCIEVWIEGTGFSNYTCPMCRTRLFYRRRINTIPEVRGEGFREEFENDGAGAGSGNSSINYWALYIQGITHLTWHFSQSMPFT